MSVVARIIKLIVGVVVVVLILGILVVLLKANPQNQIVAFIADTAGTVAGPFDGFFELKSTRQTLALNWAIAAVVYGLIAALVVAVLGRGAGTVRARRARGREVD